MSYVRSQGRRGMNAVFDRKLNDEAGRIRALQRYHVLDTEPERHFDLVTAMVKDLLDVPMCAISLVSNSRQWFKSSVGLEVPGTSRQLAFCDFTIRGRDLLVVEDALADPRFAANPLVTGELAIRSYAGAPLMTPDGYNIGALCAIDRKARSFSEQQLERLRTLACLVVEQLELRTLAHSDSLTGVLTRRAFNDAACTAIRQHRRNGTPAAVVSLDIDHFKQINDRCGHAGGDRVLREVARVCSEALRPGDVVGRLGGEEFALLLLNSNGQGAEHCANRVRRAIGELDLADCGRITASFGVSTLRDGLNIEDWMNEADAALYAAKESGRNRCVRYEVGATLSPWHAWRTQLGAKETEDALRWRCE